MVPPPRAGLILAVAVALAACGQPHTEVYLVNGDDEPYYVTLVVASGVANQTDFVVLPGEKGGLFSDTGNYSSEVVLRGTDCTELGRVSLEPGNSFLTIEAAQLEVKRDMNVADLPQGLLSEASDCVGIDP